MDSLIAENFIYDSALDKSMPDSDRHVFSQKNITPIIDQGRGSGTYTNGKIIIDAQSFGNGSDYIDWKNAYVTLPYRVTVSDTASGSATIPSANLEPSLLTALKNECLVESIRVEMGGHSIVTESQNLSHLISFQKHCTVTQDQLNTDTRRIFSRNKCHAGVLH